jgi:hypothetical protein
MEDGLDRRVKTEDGMLSASSEIKIDIFEKKTLTSICAITGFLTNEYVGSDL